jgi:hypothetical protein
MVGGVLDGATISIDAGDPAMLSIVESVGGEPPRDRVERGKKVLLGLAMSCLERRHASEATFQLSYLAPGRSGAHVCRVDVSQPGGPSQSYVLKIGLDHAALSHEREANERARDVLTDQTLVPILGDVKRNRSGYSGIIARLHDKAIPLRTWLWNDVGADRARGAAQELFGDQLAVLFRHDLRRREPVSAWLGSSALLRLRTVATLEVVAPTFEHPSAGNRTDATDLTRAILDFVKDGRIASSTARLPDNVTFVAGFGDLHSENVLMRMGTYPRPVLIDASRYDHYHWGADASRLLVNLVLRVLRPGTASLLWSDFDDVLNALSGLCHVCGTTDGPPASHPVEVFIDEVVANVDRYLLIEDLGVTEEWHWQWHVALAKELIRQATQPGLPAPRTSVGLVGAAQHLMSAGEIIDGSVTGR